MERVVQERGCQRLAFPIAYLPEGNTFTLVIPAYSQEILMLFVLEQQYARLLCLALRTEQQNGRIRLCGYLFPTLADQLIDRRHGIEAPPE